MHFVMFHLLCFNEVCDIKITNEMHFNVYDVFYSKFSHPRVSAAIVTIFRVILLQEYKGTSVVSCAIVTP